MEQEYSFFCYFFPRVEINRKYSFLLEEEGETRIRKERIFVAFFFQQMAITLIETVARTRGVVIATMNISGRHPPPLSAIPKFVFLPSIVNINSTSVCTLRVNFPTFPLYEKNETYDN